MYEVSGTLSNENEQYLINANIYEKRSKRGLNGGRISTITLDYWVGNEQSIEVVRFEKGDWITKPEKEHKKIFWALVERLEFKLSLGLEGDV